MAGRLRVFLDTNVVFAAVLSPGGGSRLLLKLGETGVVSLWVGRRVLAEADAVVTRKAPQTRPLLALLLEAANVEIAPAPSQATLAQARAVISYAPDAEVLAEAIECGADWLATLDRQHLAASLGEAELPLTIGTPGDVITHLRRWLASR